MLRTGLATLLLVVFIPAVVAANTTTWAARTVLDSTTFATTAERALDTPALESLVATTAADAIVAQTARRVPEELQVLAVQGLGLDASATRTQVSAALAERLQVALDAPAVAAAREELIASVHGYLLRTAEGTPGIIGVQGDDVVLDPTHLVDRILQTADPAIAARVEAFGLADLDPVVIAQVDDLQPVRRAIDLMQALQLIVPLVAIAVAMLIVIVAHRRERALGIVGAAVALAGGASLLVLWVAGAYVTRIPSQPAARTITSEVYDAFITVLRDQAIVLVVAGAVILVVAWILGRRARRRAVRRMVGPREAGYPSEPGRAP